MSEVQSKSVFRLALVSIFLVSSSVLAFEVALTRVFSVMLSYPFVFAIVSAAMLGLGVGGLLFRRWGDTRLDTGPWIGAVIYSLSLAVSVVLILTLPVYGSQTLASVRPWLYISLAVVPFAAAGFAISGLFRRYSGRSSLLYGADLLGAAAAALGVVPAMDRIGPVNLIFLLAAIAAVAAVLLAVPRRRHVLPALGAVVVLAGLFVTLAASGSGIRVPVATDPNKEMVGLLADPSLQARIVESRWSSFGRTDLVASDTSPNQMWVFVDGAAGSPVYNLDALLKDTQQRMQFTMHSEEYFPFLFLKKNEKRSALVIGPGGGRDVVLALLGGVRQITAVEVNPDVVKIVRQYKDYDGGIYSGRPGVTALVGEGRNYVRSSNRRFDIIMAAIPMTKSSRSVEGYALTENNLFTVEALDDYLGHLTANGRMIIVGHNDAEVFRLISIALEAFAKQGIPQAEAMARIYTVASDMMPAVVIQKQPLTTGEATAVHQKLHELGFDKGAFFIPRVQQQTAGSLRMLDQSLVDVSDGSLSMAAVVRSATADVSPTTDDRPFFYKSERGLPSPFGSFAILLAISAVALVALTALPGRRGYQSRSFMGALRTSPQLKTYILLFFALGIGYMLIEIAFFQKLTLYISQPQMALTVLLFSLLLGNGIGALLTSLLHGRRLRYGAAIAVAVAALITWLAIAFPKVFALGLDPRIATTLLILPLGILMGCPFPLAVKTLNENRLEGQTAVMWGVNGAASVFGSILSMIIGISWGFSDALFLGAGVYVGIATLFLLLGRQMRVSSDTGRLS